MRLKLLYKTFKILKTVLFNRKVYKYLKINKISRFTGRFPQNRNRNVSFTNLYFPYSFFFNRSYKNLLTNKQKFSCFYGSTSEKSLKKKFQISSRRLKLANLSNIHHRNIVFIEMFENRLDTILYRTYFVLNFKQARQLILHNHILVNSKRTKNFFRFIKVGDFISVSAQCHTLIRKNITESLKFEFLPTNLEINYRTFQICCVARLKNVMHLNNFNLLDDYKLEYSINAVTRFFKTY